MRQFFTEDNDRLSMKRFCAFVGTISLCVIFVTKPSDELIYAITFIVSSSLGFTSVEKLFKK